MSDTPSLEDTAPAEHFTESGSYWRGESPTVTLRMSEEQFRRTFGATRSRMVLSATYDGDHPVGSHVEILTEEGMYVAEVTAPGVITLW